MKIKLPIVDQFGTIFEQEITLNRVHYKEPDGHFRNYRALKQTFISKKINAENLEESDFQVLVQFLLKSELFGSLFKEWVETHSLEWEWKTLPCNTILLYEIGRRVILERNDKI